MVGYADGLVILWDLATETVIGQARLHGAVQHAALFDNDAIVATDLGESTVFDIGALPIPDANLLEPSGQMSRLSGGVVKVPRKSLDSITTA